MNRISGQNAECRRRDFLKRTAAAPALGLTAIILQSPAHHPNPSPAVPPAGPAPQGSPPVRRDRPSLHLAPHGPTVWKERARTTHRRYAELLHDAVERSASWVPPRIPARPGSEVLLEEAGAFLTNAALSWLLTGEKRHFDLARGWALALCDQPIPNLRNYGRGVYAAGMGRLYDWLHKDLSTPEREVIRSHLEALVLGLYQASFPGTSSSEWWAGLPLHHDHWIAVGGLGEAALALAPEMLEALTWAERTRAAFDLALSWLGEDGAWHEGPADWAYAMAPLLWFYSAWQSATGEDLHSSAWLRSTASYRLYHWLPDDTCVYLDDSFRSGRYNTSGSAACHLLRRLAALYSDGAAQWLAERDEQVDLSPLPRGVYQAPYESHSMRGELAEYPNAALHCAAWNLLWYDPEIVPEEPVSLPPARRFENQGITILRTGWDEDAAVVSLSAGSMAGRVAATRIRSGEELDPGNVHHCHADYGSLTLFAAGEYLVVPAGYARRSSRFQNVVSVNGADFLADPGIDARVLAFDSDADPCYVAADLTAAFPADLQVESYRRHLLFFQDGWLVLFDDLRLRDSASESFNHFQWKLHGDPSTHRISASGRQARWRSLEGTEDLLALHILQPEEFSWVREELESTSGTPLLQSVGLVRPEWYHNEMKVLVVLDWSESRAATSPTGIRGVIGFRWPSTPIRPAVVFAHSTESPSGIDLQGCELILVATEESDVPIRRMPRGS